MLSTEAYNNSKHEMGRALRHLFLRDGAVSIFTIGAFDGEDATCHSDLFQNEQIFISIKKFNLAHVHSSFYLKKKQSPKVCHFLSSVENGLLFSSCINTKSNT
jgi:hypothetical protein